MMNIGNLGLEEILGINFKEDIGTELCLRLWLLSQDGFESGCRGSKS